MLISSFYTYQIQNSAYSSVPLLVSGGIRAVPAAVAAAITAFAQVFGGVYQVAILVEVIISRR